MNAIVTHRGALESASTVVEALDAGRVDGVRAVGARLSAIGLHKDAAALFGHLADIRVGDPDILVQWARALASDGQTLQAIDVLVGLKQQANAAALLMTEVPPVMQTAIAKFNLLQERGEIAAAAPYARAMANLLPGNLPLLDAAFSCCLALGQLSDALAYAQRLLALEPNHLGALGFIRGLEPVALSMGNDAIDDLVERVLSNGSDDHPLIRLRDMFDAVSAILCSDLTERRAAQVKRILAAAQYIEFVAEPGSELADWEKHYRLALAAVNVPSLLDKNVSLPNQVFATRGDNRGDDEVDCCDSGGTPMHWTDIRATATAVGAEVVFFAAADTKYVDLYARWYVKSVLKHCDRPCLIVLHVIGGAGRLAEIAQSIGVLDARFVLVADAGVPHSARARNYDAPPKGHIAAPVAYYQSVRFLRLAALLRNVQLPVFVSDIDLLLQHGVDDLLERCAAADIVLNENDLNLNAGSRLTANLLLVKPTRNAFAYLDFLSAYLDQALGAEEVSRWIDQFGLLMARHYLRQTFGGDGMQYFDTTTDINNIMYRAYQDNPFRFLSLYHGFDTSTLEQD